MYPMSVETFVDDCKRTEAPVTKENRDLVNREIRNLLILAMQTADVATLADNMKRNCFYLAESKPNPELAEIINKYDLIPDNILLTPTDYRRIHMCLGLISEVGELAAVVINSLIRDQPVSPAVPLEEGGDILYYLGVLLNTWGIKTLEEPMTAVVNKLKERYPKAFNLDDCLNRNTEAEQQAMTPEGEGVKETDLVQKIITRWQNVLNTSHQSEYECVVAGEIKQIVDYYEKQLGRR